jgi:hypothetical protein
MVYNLQVNVFIMLICNFKHMILGKNDLVVLMNLVAWKGWILDFQVFTS